MKPFPSQAISPSQLPPNQTFYKPQNTLKHPQNHHSQPLLCPGLDGQELLKSSEHTPTLTKIRKSPPKNESGAAATLTLYLLDTLRRKQGGQGLAPPPLYNIIRKVIKIIPPPFFFNYYVHKKWTFFLCSFMHGFLSTTVKIQSGMGTRERKMGRGWDPGMRPAKGGPLELSIRRSCGRRMQQRFGRARWWPSPRT